MGLNEDITAFLGADGCERLLRRRAVYRSELIKQIAVSGLTWALCFLLLIACGAMIYNAGTMDIDAISGNISECALILVSVLIGEFIADYYRVKRILLKAEKEVNNYAGSK